MLSAICTLVLVIGLVLLCAVVDSAIRRAITKAQRRKSATERIVPILKAFSDEKKFNNLTRDEATTALENYCENHPEFTPPPGLKEFCEQAETLRHLSLLVSKLQEGRVCSCETPEGIRKEILNLLGENNVCLEDLGLDERQFGLIVMEAYGGTEEAVKEMTRSYLRASEYHTALVRRGVKPESLSNEDQMIFEAF